MPSSFLPFPIDIMDNLSSEAQYQNVHQDHHEGFMPYREGCENEEYDLEELDQFALEDSQKKHAKGRPRKKLLYKNISDLMEFYLSDANITKSRMIRELLVKNEYIDLKVFLDFHKLQKFAKSIFEIQRGIQCSSLLELSQDKLSVKRITPFDPEKVKSKEEEEKCTIYVENVPSYFDHDKLKSIFVEFGPTAYISLPKYKHNGVPKGFAFIEFTTPESAESCLEAYGAKGACLSSTLSPENLMSIQTFEPEMPFQNVQKTPSAKNSPRPLISGDRKRSHKEIQDEVGNKRLKLGEDGSSASSSPAPIVRIEEPEIKTEDTSKEGNIDADNESVEEEKKEIPSSSKVVSEIPQIKIEEVKSKKKNKKRKQNKTKNIQIKLESDVIQMKILPKGTWRQLRNRYLNLQRENMSRIKRELKAQREGVDEEEKLEYEKQTKRVTSVVVRIEFDQPPASFDDLKRMIEEMVPPTNEDIIKFVDYIEGLSCIVRLDGRSEYGLALDVFLQNSKSAFKSVYVLNESEAFDYWKEVRSRLSEKKPQKNVRGRDKLIQKAIKAAEETRTRTHIRFNEQQEDK